MKKKINIKNINVEKNIARSNGITLIALIITIIILLILAGVTINLTLGENGLFNTAKRAGEDYEKAGIKEEIEYAIVDIKIEKLQNGEELTMDILEKNLPNKLKDIIVERDDEGQIVGEYKGYDYTITKDYEVIVESVGVKPVVTYTLSDETIGINELTITLKATISEGNITKIIKPDGNYEENVDEVQHKVTQNGKYKFIVEASNGTKATKVIQITNLRPIAPIIKSDEAYPVLTQYGVEGAKVEIVYEENENLEHYYSEDNGTTWKIYTGEFKPTSSTIIAKSVVKANTDCYTQTQVDNILPSNALGPEAYDEDKTTCVVYKGTGPIESYINVSQEMQGKTITLLRSMGHGTTHGIKYYNEKDEEISSEMMTGNVVDLETEYIIPKDTKKIGIYYSSNNSQDWGQVKEITAKNQPVFNVRLYYPELSNNKIGKGYNKIQIDYYDTSVQRLYNIDNGEWKNYSGEEIRLEIGETLYAKGIDKEGKETDITNYEAVLPSDALGIEAYDGDNSTKVSYKGTGPIESYISVSQEMQGKTIILLRSMGHYTTHGIKYYNEKDEEISSEMMTGHVADLETEHIIPEGTKKIGIYYSSNNSQDWGEVKEVKVKNN